MDEKDLLNLLPSVYYMDPPDGGSVTVIEQLQRMAKDAERYRWLRDMKSLYLGPVVGARRDNLGERHILSAVSLGCSPPDTETLDAAIDYAMAKRR